MTEHLQPPGKRRSTGLQPIKRVHFRGKAGHRPTPRWVSIRVAALSPFRQIRFPSAKFVQKLTFGGSIHILQAASFRPGLHLHCLSEYSNHCRGGHRTNIPFVMRSSTPILQPYLINMKSPAIKIPGD